MLLIVVVLLIHVTFSACSFKIEEVDWGFVRTICATREFFLHWETLRKQIYFASYTVVLVLLILLIVRVDLTHVSKWMEYLLIVLVAVIYGTEPLTLLLQTLSYPTLPVGRLEYREREDTSEIAVVIPCFQSADVIVRTCESIIRHLKPEQIFVMDGATFLAPPDNTRQMLAEADLHEVNYSKFLRKGWTAGKLHVFFL